MVDGIKGRVEGNVSYKNEVKFSLDSPHYRLSRIVCIEVADAVYGGGAVWDCVRKEGRLFSFFMF